MPLALAPEPDVDASADEALVAAYRRGDERAFEVLFARYRDRVTGYAWRMLGRREEAEEVCVEAFCRVVEGRWSPTGRFRAFLFTVVHRRCLDRIRRRGRKQRALQLLGFGRTADPTPQDALELGERNAQLEAALRELPEEHRATVMLFYGQELGSKEVAAVLGCTDQQVRSRLSYARRKLRKALESQEASP